MREIGRTSSDGELVMEVTIKGPYPLTSGCYSFAHAACADGVVRVFKLDDASKFLRINMKTGRYPTAVAFLDDGSSVVVATQTLSGSSLYMFGEEKVEPSSGNQQQQKLPVPEIKWEHHKVQDKHAILNLFASDASYGTADGSAIVASCSEGVSSHSC
ncbi:hypothetical protein Ancab_037147 [Ancistrocladus abbreviatus]